jgi:hypothetical protein
MVDSLFEPEPLRNSFLRVSRSRGMDSGSAVLWEERIAYLVEEHFSLMANCESLSAFL